MAKMDKNDIINKEFTHAFWGYDVIEVDLFLDEVIRELERLRNELDIAQMSAEEARRREDVLRERLIRLTRGEGGPAEGSEEEQSAYVAEQDGAETETEVETETEAETETETEETAD